MISVVISEQAYEISKGVGPLALSGTVYTAVSEDLATANENGS